ncbi:DUF1015 family protein [Nocardioides pakistanensis]
MAGTGGRAPLVLAPFRGLRFDASVVGDLGSVISPPYDVLDADTVRELEARNRRNIVRLILPRSHEGPYLAVRRRLETWRAEGCLVPDREPGLYLYEYTVDGSTVRGLVGLVGLREERDMVVLPHEDVMPGPVEDRTVLMRTTGTNPEPILLVHHGPPALRDLLGRVASRRPLEDFTTREAGHHRLWSITAPDELAEIAQLLAPGQVLIADGHHRYAAYLALQREERPTGAPPGASPWDYGLAMVVDQGDHPLTVGPIHRFVTGMTLSDVLDAVAERDDQSAVPVARDAALAAVSDPAARDPDQAVFALSDGRAWVRLTAPRTHDVDAAVLHTGLLPAWNVSEEQVGYHHSIDQAVQMTARHPGVVIGVRPPGLHQVMVAASRGERMPRKSTSFSPKPRMGLVLRDLRDA